MGHELQATSAEGHAYLHLLQHIRVGYLQPGDRLIPEEIAAKLDMSRMPVRVALRRLATEGLVTIRPNRGCVVSSLSGLDIQENFEMRSVLEGLAVRLAVPNISPSIMVELEHRLHLMHLADTADSDSWMTKHQEFHDYLCSLSQRTKLLRQIRTLHASIEPYLRVYFHHAPKERSADDAHRELIRVIQIGDAEQAEQAMRVHIMGTVPLITKFMNANAHKTATISDQTAIPPQ